MRDEVGRGHFGYTCAAKVNKGSRKGESVAVKVIPKAKVMRLVRTAVSNALHLGSTSVCSPFWWNSEEPDPSTRYLSQKMTPYEYESEIYGCYIDLLCQLMWCPRNMRCECHF
jgi:hypothetical protein